MRPVEMWQEEMARIRFDISSVIPAKAGIQGEFCHP